MITGLISIIVPLLFNSVFIGLVSLFFFICCVLLMTRKGTSFFRYLMYTYVIICLLFFTFLLWCVIGFGNKHPQSCSCSILYIENKFHPKEGCRLAILANTAALLYVKMISKIKRS